MIPVVPLPEPPEFDEKARQPGLAWLEANPGAKRPKDFWSPFKPDLADGFHQLCGYTAMYEPVGTVDHFLPVNPERHLAYEWRNYRFAAGWVNSSKRTASVLDPFDVKSGWFEILLPSLQLVVTDAVPTEYRELAQYTLERLHLQDDERVLRQRREWLRMYEHSELALAGLWKKAPLIAEAVERSGVSERDYP